LFAEPIDVASELAEVGEPGVVTWITGVVLFGISIGTSFTGFLSQSNFSSQWIAAEGKDGINSTGAGAFFNVLNPGQMLLWHVVLLPAGVGLLTLLHIILVRRRGVVPPLDAKLEG
jgi:quinol-cytochrome oxidoreductase complex cytochrome b subunit